MRLYITENAFFSYLRKRMGIDKPIALEWGKWDEWNDKVKKEKPFAYFLTETVPGWIEDAAHYIPTPIADIRYYCRNRFMRKTHMLRTNTKFGEYSDMDTRILEGVMNAIVDYVEVELAWKSRWCNTDESKTAKWKKGRCPALGLAHLAWEMTLDDPALDENNRGDSQAVTAREVRALYDWWTVTRPARPDPMDASGWSELCKKDRLAGKKMFQHGTKAQEKHKSLVLARLREIEEAAEKEDEDMLVRVIKIRRCLWT